MDSLVAIPLALPCPNKCPMAIGHKRGPFQLECAICGLEGPRGLTREDAVKKWNELPRFTSNDMAAAREVGGRLMKEAACRSVGGGWGGEPQENLECLDPATICKSRPSPNPLDSMVPGSPEHMTEYAKQFFEKLSPKPTEEKKS